MAFTSRLDKVRQPTSVRTSSRSNKREEMSYWRWLLFAAMARFESRKDKYLRIPSAKTIPHDVTVDVYSDGDPSTLGKASYARLIALINRKRRKR